MDLLSASRALLAERLVASLDVAEADEVQKSWRPKLFAAGMRFRPGDVTGNSLPQQFFRDLHCVERRAFEKLIAYDPEA